MTATLDSDALGMRGALHAERTAAGDGSRLGMQLGEAHWLLELADVNEIIAVPELTEVPFTRHWFAGVASVRGHPVAAVDLAAFFGAARIEAGERTRLVVVAERHRINSALLVSRVLGLQPFDRFVREPDPSPQPTWIEGCYRDPGGQRWIALDMHGLMSHPDFLRIELPA